MGARHADRIWMAAGVVAIALLAVVTWFLAVSPQHAETADLRAEAETTQTQADQLRARIVKLTADNANQAALVATLNDRRIALPEDSGVPAFLRQLQAAGTRFDVDVSGLTVGQPAPDDTVSGVWSLPLELTAQGTAARLSSFLTQLQGGDMMRSVLIRTAGIATDRTGDTSATNELSLNLTATAFVAPPAGATVVPTATAAPADAAVAPTAATD
jgi:type IV pilus assembly protein PilO